MKQRGSDDADSAVIALSVGDPAGIGPDITTLLAARGWPGRVAVYADPAVLAARARRLNLDLSVCEIAAPADAAEPHPGRLDVVPVAVASSVTPGRADVANSAYVLRCLDGAIDACRAGTVAAMVTGPVSKALINESGVPFSGHTEYIAERCGIDMPVMLLVSGRLRVALATTHLPLARVATALTRERVERTATILAHDLHQRFGLAHPRIAVCGLNPHAGEQGHLGGQEQAVIEPAIAALTARGLAVDGPLPADTVFAPGRRDTYDAILAMYHDQGLAPLKALSFGDAVNVTLGLPIVRTSVDHGTAFDLAGSGDADPSSLLAAVELALTLGPAACHG